MHRVRHFLGELLHPPTWVLILIPPLSFAALIFVFATKNEKTLPTYIIYGMSAYSLAVLAAALPGLIKRTKTAIAGSRLMKNKTVSRVTGQYLNDLAYRGSVSMYQGMAANFVYALFQLIVCINYPSAWIVSMAAYYLLLGGLRLYLILCSRRAGADTGYRCYRKTAWLLFVLNIPMGGMIVLMVHENFGISYPGYIIYLSALYTFYAMTVSVINLAKFRKLGSPVLSAAKVLNFISAMMSVLYLQTAMINRFSANDEAYRKMMNSITGGAVYAIVIILAVYMLLHGKETERGHKKREQIGK